MGTFLSGLDIIHDGQCPEGARKDRPEGIPPGKKHHFNRGLAGAANVAAPVENQGVLEAAFPNLQPPGKDTEIGINLVVRPNKAGVQSLERRPNLLLVIQACFKLEVEMLHVTCSSL